MSQQNLLVVIAGPTAVGKTSVSLSLAQYFHGEIISADSRQFYREMEIGTAKPAQEELNSIAHHFVNSHSIQEDYDAGSFARDAEPLLDSLFTKNKVQFMVGGSGLYIKAFCDGLDEMPEVPKEIRNELNEEFRTSGLEPMLAELKRSDPEYYEVVDKYNPQRVIRGVEVLRATGKPYSQFRKDNVKKSHDFRILKIGLSLDREVLYDRIDQRMDVMIEEGLFEEAESLYPMRSQNALQTVGYKEIFDFIEGQYDKDEAVRLLKRNSRRYAKRQLTWFRKDPEFHWFQPNQMEAIIARIEQEID
ncbi:MAG: tRNA (adenosine(37)-N6)-dimethylallyltransferase MiaA [Reichenbachiella sp.]|uniref:tRNA (adenosine(37)-N6)-dimethylallyltransferase MiaA n=1 Tax=Reichenbachiella sp. TaxID=2184521 RepID=UPI003263687F